MTKGKAAGSRNKKKQRQRERRQRLRLARENLINAAQDYLTLYSESLAGNPLNGASTHAQATAHTLRLVQANIARFSRNAANVSSTNCGALCSDPQEQQRLLPENKISPVEVRIKENEKLSAEAENSRVLNAGPETRATFQNSMKNHPLIVLFQPEIPPNTGTIARLCAAFRMPLILIGPLGFDVSEKAFRRAGLDYWPWVDIAVFGNWQAFLAQKLHRRLVFVETSGKTPIGDYTFEVGDALIFGSETKGIPVEVLEASYTEPTLEIKIPMWQENVRSINIANSVSIAASRALHWASGLSHAKS